jgi:uncharacterized membrane protein
MNIVPRLLFVLTLVIVPAIVYATTATLPERIATHFGNGGYANGWMSHDGYLAFMLAMTTLVPLFVVASTGYLPRIATSQIKIANREHWLSPSRRAETLAWLASHGCWMGIIVALFLGGLHLLTVQANAQVPPRMVMPYFVVLLAIFGVAIVAWIAATAARFRRSL